MYQITNTLIQWYSESRHDVYWYSMETGLVTIYSNTYKPSAAIIQSTVLRLSVNLLDLCDRIDVTTYVALKKTNKCFHNIFPCIYRFTTKYLHHAQSVVFNKQTPLASSLFFQFMCGYTIPMLECSVFDFKNIGNLTIHFVNIYQLYTGNVRTKDSLELCFSNYMHFKIFVV